jgi:hypothetical protein
MFRKIGYLKSGTKRSVPKRFLFFDTESRIEKQNEKITALPFRLGIAIFAEYGNDYQVKIRNIIRFHNVSDFISILRRYLKKRNTLQVVAHNIAHDIMTLDLVQELHKAGFVSQPPIMNNRLFIWRVSSEQGNAVFFDTANYSIISVESLGKDLGFPKLKIDFDNCTDDELFVYCERDVAVLEKFMTNYLTFVKDNNLGGFCYSLASQALAAWRYRFMEQSIFIHNHPDLLQLERDGYHGGRVECFFIGTKLNEQHYYLDINSMYPHCMREYQLPYRPHSYNKNVSIKQLNAGMANYYAIARVELNTKTNAFPYIRGDRLIFPTGKFTTVLHHSELEIALKTHSIVKVIELGLYEQSYLFRDYVDFFYSMKLDAEKRQDGTYRLMAKLFLNSLYGKFAQHNVIRRKLDGEYPDIIFRAGGFNQPENYRFQEFIWFGDAYEERKQGETAHSSPALAGAITAIARTLLYLYINKAGPRDCLYCDTDSLIVTANGYNKLLSDCANGVLGKLKIERQSTRLRIYAPKDYLFGNQKRHKGIPNKAERIDINVWLVDEWLGVKTWISDGATGIPYITRHRKEAKHVYNKGIVDEKTGYVSPFYLR